MSQGHVYTLELEGGNFYVGHSLDVETRIAAHFLGNGAGARWTNLHRPVRVLSVVPGDTLLENCTPIALIVSSVALRCGVLLVAGHDSVCTV